MCNKCYIEFMSKFTHSFNIIRYNELNKPIACDIS